MLRSREGIVVDCAELSHPGRDPAKQVNEDAMALAEVPFGVVAVVCDGMGGHASGEVASRAAVARILEVLRAGGPALERLLASALEQAHADVYALGGDAPIDVRPGSTAVIVALSGAECFVAHVGDSRAYRVRGGVCERLTRDHSVVEALLAAGAIGAEQAKNHPDANRITRALGISPELEPELSPPFRLEIGDAFVLCSDGLSDLVDDPEIAERVSSAPTPDAACGALVQLANDRGGHDNVTVQVLRVLGFDATRARADTGEFGVAPVKTAPGMAAPTLAAPGVVAPETVVDQPAFTVLMGADSERTPGMGPEATRGTLPTLVDGAHAQHAAHPHAAHPHAHPHALLHPHAGATPVSGSAPLPTPPPSPSLHPRTQAQHQQARLLFWAGVGLSALILIVIALWAIVR